MEVKEKLVLSGEARSVQQTKAKWAYTLTLQAILGRCFSPTQLELFSEKKTRTQKISRDCPFKGYGKVPICHELLDLPGFFSSFSTKLLRKDLFFSFFFEMFLNIKYLVYKFI